MLKNKFYMRLLIIGVFIRLLVMPFYFHPDIKTYHFQSSFLKTGVINIYKYLDENKQELPLKDEFVYFPLTYLTLGSYQAIVNPILGEGFNDWLYDASQQSVERVGIYRYLLVLKFPYLLFDIAVAVLLVLMFSKKKKQRMAFTLWMFNPITIALIYMYANVDIIPVFFTLLSIYLVQKKSKLWGAVSLGIAAGFKAYPLLFMPFIIFKGNDVKEKLLIFISGFGTFLVIVAPFLSTSFQKASLVSGLTTRIVSYGMSLGFGEIIMPAIVAITIIYFLALEGRGKLIIQYLSVLLIIFSFIHIHIQWLLWAMPFLVYLYVSERKLRPVVVIITVAAFAIPLLYNDRFMNVSLLQAYSYYFNLVPTPFVILRKVFDPFILQGVLHSIFAAGSIYVVWKGFVKK